jgi:ecotin
VLPALDKKEMAKCEIYIGKKMMVDCNRHTLMGSWEQYSVPGWGYSYYQFSSKGLLMSTKMACPEISDTEKFVHGEGQIIPYNSRKVHVIFAPKGYELVYRTWTASKDFKKP